MTFGTALRRVRQERGISSAAVGHIGFVSEEMVRAVEAGRRRFAPDVMGKIADGIGAPQLVLAAAREVTGGTFTAPWLDGDQVDLHRCSVGSKLREELKEAMAAVEGMDLANKPRLDEQSQRQMRDILLQVLDVHVAIDHFVAIVATEYKVSVVGLYSEHERKLRELGYLRREAPEKERTRAAL